MAVTVAARSAVPLMRTDPWRCDPAYLLPLLDSYIRLDLTDMLWVEEPVGMARTDREPAITNEMDLDRGSIDFLKIGLISW